MIGVSDESAHLPVWVRRRDGGQVPFEADRICQSLYVAAESLGAANAFLIRELTDAVLHFLAQQSWDAIPTTSALGAEVAKIVREIGQPLLAKRYAELQEQPDRPAVQQITVACASAPDRFVKDCLDAYILQAVFSRDVAAAVRDGLLTLRGQETPATLASLVLQTPRLPAGPWRGAAARRRRRWRASSCKRRGSRSCPGGPRWTTGVSPAAIAGSSRAPNGC